MRRLQCCACFRLVALEGVAGGVVCCRRQRREKLLFFSRGTLGCGLGLKGRGGGGSRHLFIVLVPLWAGTVSAQLARYPASSCPRARRPFPARMRACWNQAS